MFTLANFLPSPSDVKTFKNMTFAVSGHSTRNTAKLSYKINIDKDDGTLHEYRRFKLRAMALDQSYLKDELGYDIANKMGLPTSKNSYVRLFINDKPIGLFGLAEVFKNPWIRNEFANGNKSFIQGALFVADDSHGEIVHFPSNSSQNITSTTYLGGNTSISLLPNVGSDLYYLGDNVTLYEAPYSLKEKPSVGAANYTRIMELTKFISQQPNNTMVDDSYAEAWEDYLDVESVLRELAHEILISNMDGYTTLANNYILYEDLEKERFVMAPQDFDLSMGTIAYHKYITGNYSEFFGFYGRPLTATLLKVPKYKQRLEELLYNVTTNLINPAIMYPRIDSLSQLLYQDVEWDKSLSRVVANATFSFGGDVPFSIAINGSYANYTASNTPDPDDFASKYNITSLFLKEWVQVRCDNIFKYFNGTGCNTTTV